MSRHFCEPQSAMFAEFAVAEKRKFEAKRDFYYGRLAFISPDAWISLKIAASAHVRTCARYFSRRKQITHRNLDFYYGRLAFIRPDCPDFSLKRPSVTTISLRNL